MDFRRFGPDGGTDERVDGLDPAFEDSKLGIFGEDAVEFRGLECGGFAQHAGHDTRFERGIDPRLRAFVVCGVHP